VTRDDEDARMFDGTADAADERAFADRCEADRHHFRFIISPEDAATLGDLKTFTRELSLDRALRDISDECGDVADLRSRADTEDAELRRLL
jgi:type IV secretory pathway VirD2 relaxase